MTKIEWTDKTWNPIVGCSVVSPGCKNCYAMRMAHRLANMSGGTGGKYQFLTKVVNGHPVWNGNYSVEALAYAPPLSWTKPRRIFVCSMGDLFFENVDDETINAVFEVMGACEDQGLGHVFQILTKRAKRFHDYMSSGLGHVAYNKRRLGRSVWPPPNVWGGVSVEDQERADERIPWLLATPLNVRFISAEPLLGPVDLTSIAFRDGGARHRQNALTGQARLYGKGVDGHPDITVETEPLLNKLDWIIAGGESGPGARPMHPDWARSLRDQCQATGVAFFFKQWGAWAPHAPSPGGDLGGDVRSGRVRIVHCTGQSDLEVFQKTGGRNTLPGSRYMARVGKKVAGRELDGRTWDEFPSPTSDLGFAPSLRDPLTSGAKR